MSAITEAIEDIDQELGLFRKAWLEAPIEKKAHWLNKINALLDRRNAVKRATLTNQQPKEKQ